MQNSISYTLAIFAINQISSQRDVDTGRMARSHQSIDFPHLSER